MLKGQELLLEGVKPIISSSEFSSPYFLLLLELSLSHVLLVLAYILGMKLASNLECIRVGAFTFREGLPHSYQLLLHSLDLGLVLLSQELDI